MYAEKLFNQAVRQQLENDLEGAKLSYQKLLRQYPSHPDILANLGAIVRRQGKAAAAEMLLKRSLRANPKHVAALRTLSNLRLSQHQYDEALQIAETALAIAPNYAEAHINLGAAYAKRGQLKKAESAFRIALGLAPRSAAARMNLANCFRMQKVGLEDSIQQLESLVAEEPNNDELMTCISMAYLENRQYARAIKYAERAYALNKSFENINQIASMQIIVGEFETAIQHYKDSLHIDPNNRDAANTLLFALNYDDRLTPEHVFEEYKKFAAGITSKNKYSHHAHPGSAGRRIRIGYLSPDFYTHVCMFFMEPIFKNLDRASFELFAYSNVLHPDEVTQRIKNSFEHWVDASDLSDDELAKKINEDGIDILVDLAGHTHGNRLRAMAQRPAPIQATYLGYGYTTGMSEIDYFIGDENFTPVGCEHLFSERIARIPAPLYAYEPPGGGATPDDNALPALAKGYVTFGSMSRIIRFNNRLLGVWKQILDRVPGSKLRLDQKPFGDPETCERVLARLEALGYRRDQIELVSSSPHWVGYHEFDISPDCWPHNAGTTTFEALWMGVPVVSKRDRPSVGRLSEMVLRPLGFGDWIVDSEAEFIERAVAAAADLPKLADMRATMRERIMTSPFLDYRARARGLEDGYRTMIQRLEEENA